MCVVGNLTVDISNYYGGVNAVLASTATTLCFSILFPADSPMLMSSSLAGIQSETQNTNSMLSMAYILVTGIFILLIYKVNSGICMDLGGRPGTIAFFSNFLTTFVAWLISLLGPYTINIKEIMYNPLDYQVFDIYLYIFGPLIGALGSVGVFWVTHLKDNFTKMFGRIDSYAIIGLYGSLWLVALTTPFYTKPGGDIVSYGQYLAGVWHVGVLAGITDKKRFKIWIPRYNFHNYLITGYIGGWIYIGLGGMVHFGGKQGFSAFLANNVLVRLLELFNYICKFDKSEVENKANDKNNKDDKNNDKIDIVVESKNNNQLSFEIKKLKHSQVREVDIAIIGGKYSKNELIDMIVYLDSQKGNRSSQLVDDKESIETDSIINNKLNTNENFK